MNQPSAVIGRIQLCFILNNLDLLMTGLLESQVIPKMIEYIHIFFVLLLFWIILPSIAS